MDSQPSFNQFADHYKQAALVASILQTNSTSFAKIRNMPSSSSIADEMVSSFRVWSRNSGAKHKKQKTQAAEQSTSLSSHIRMKET